MFQEILQGGNSGGGDGLRTGVKITNVIGVN